MDSVILRIAARGLTPLMVALALYLLWAGHNAPGGGFVAGLLVGTAFVLKGAAFGIGRAGQSLRFDPRTWLGVGLAVAIASSLVAVAAGRPWFTGMWWTGGWVPLGTPLLFDVGVAIVVASVVVLMMLALGEND